MYNLQIVEERVMFLLNKQHLSKNKLLECSGLNKSVFDNMKKGQKPSIDKIHILADYLDCSVDYLLGRTENPNSHKTLPAALSVGNDFNNRGIIGNIGNGNSPVTINTNNSLDENALEMLNIYNNLTPVNRSKLMVYADELKKNKD